MLPSVRDFENPDRLKRRTVLGILNRLVPGDPTLEVEVDRAPDSGGSPGTWATIARVGPFPQSGGYFFDHLPRNTSTLWYRARHVGPGVTSGAYTTPVSGTPRQFDDAELQAYLLATNVYPVIRTAPMSDGDFALVSTVNDGLTAKNTVKESGGKAINRQLSKVLASDSDDLNSVVDGSTFKKVAAVNGSNQVTPSSVQATSRCRVRMTGAQSIANNTQTAINWAAEYTDPGNLHDNSTNNERITIATSGFYIITAQGQWQAGGSGQRQLVIRKNGSTEIARAEVFSQTAGFIQAVVAFDDLANGDYLEVLVLQLSGASLDFGGSESVGINVFQVVHVF